MIFHDFVKSRQEQARRSILVRVQSRENCDRLISFCLSCGPIANVYYYRLLKENAVALIEMKDKQASNALFARINSFSNISGFKMFSPFVEANFSVLQTSEDVKSVEVQSEDPVKADFDDAQWEELGSDAVFWNMYHSTKMNEFSLRLRFLVSLQLETILRSMIKNCSVLPFGGSINGFGSCNSDLDLTFLLTEMSHRNPVSFKTGYSLSCLSKDYFNLLTLVIKDFVPGCRNVCPIPKAKVPIISFYHHLTELECDICVNSPGGLMTSEILYIMGKIHYLVKPMASILKKWAKEVKLTDADRPNCSLSNFTLLSLIIFFLQQKKNGLKQRLPGFNVFPVAEKQLYFSHNHYKVIEQNLNEINLDFETDDKLDYAIYKFFEFYHLFNFKVFGMSLRSGKLIENAVGAPLLIQNPLNEYLNVANAVSYKRVNMLKKYVKIAKEMYEEKNGFTSDFFRIEYYNGDRSLHKNVVEKVKESVQFVE